MKSSLGRKGLRIHIAPTYSCMLSCPYCCTAQLRSSFQCQLQFSQYCALVRRLMSAGLSSVSFLGGEPTLWPWLHRAVAFARELGLKTLLYTNALITNGAPDLVIANVSDWLRTGPLPRQVECLQWYADHKSALALRLNLQPNTLPRHLGRTIKTAQVLRAQMSFAAIDCRPHDIAYGGRIFNLCVDLVGSGLAVKLSRPLPLCIFGDFEREFLKVFCGMRGACDLETTVPVVNPDAATAFPCNSVFVPFAVKWIERRDRPLGIKAFWDRLMHIVPNECMDCQHFRRGKCHCGCLANRRCVPEADSFSDCKDSVPSMEDLA